MRARGIVLGLVPAGGLFRIWRMVWQVWVNEGVGLRLCEEGEMGRGRGRGRGEESVRRAVSVSWGACRMKWLRRESWDAVYGRWAKVVGGDGVGGMVLVENGTVCVKMQGRGWMDIKQNRKTGGRAWLQGVCNNRR